MVRARRLDEYLRQLGTAAGGLGAGEQEGGLEELLRRVVEEAVREALEKHGIGASGAGAAEAAEVLERLGRLEERLRSLEEAITGLREEIRRSRGGLTRRDIEELAKAIAAAVSVAREQAPQASREPKWLRYVAERLREKGVVFVDELPPDVRAEIDTGVLEARGYRVIAVAGRRVVATRQALDEFLEKLRRLRASDEYEAEAALEKYGRLFRLLRSEGLIYYAGPSRGWVLEKKAEKLLT
ncbi:hypothetical protein PYJP_06470 [Pyrofollis japonicus]|uniref:hypothetical protein n=1 Tax=Pyrofollis japonicus TaxID=3060460 RepID=UPI00295B8E86|nr:hypothetical protein [Pyrofollis japonicus]BEP17295.1 hypothetical protein PYJP_06470 [Pyrofollis japonicus]